jgi:SAM-dependent methyltransferase
MAFRDRLAPVLAELIGARFEQLPAIVAGRQKLVAPATGRVLEVGAGPGWNLRYYPPVDELVATDSVDGMLDRARKRAGPEVVTARAAVEELPYEDGSFDTVVASLLLCSVADPDRALAEIRRVLRPGGQYLFLEHVRSNDPKIARRQDRLERLWGVVAFGCHPNRDTLPRIEAAFDVRSVEHDELPKGPKIIRPYVLGRAVKQGQASA